MMFALLLPVLLGMVALAIDVGTYASERRELQNAADSIALAAAQELPDEDDAQAVAAEWIGGYGIDPDDVAVTVQPKGAGNSNPSVRVVIARPHEFNFIQVLGVADKEVGAAATAIKTSPGGAGNLVPWSVLEKTKDDSEMGELVTLKYDSDNVSNGNFGSIRIDGNGSKVYGDSVQNGSDSMVCSTAVSSCNDTSPVCDSPVCPSEPGNATGPTRSAVDYRMDNTDPKCDELSEVFFGPIAGRYSVRSECNPFAEGSFASLRLIIVPIVENLCNGSCDMTITDFALFWLEGYEDNKCSGNFCEIKGRFVDADATIGALTGVYDPTASVHFAKLSE